MGCHIDEAGWEHYLQATQASAEENARRSGTNSVTKTRTAEDTVDRVRKESQPLRRYYPPDDVM